MKKRIPFSFQCLSLIFCISGFSVLAQDNSTDHVKMSPMYYIQADLDEEQARSIDEGISSKNSTISIFKNRLGLPVIDYDRKSHSFTVVARCNQKRLDLCDTQIKTAQEKLKKATCSLPYDLNGSGDFQVTEDDFEGLKESDLEKIFQTEQTNADLFEKQYKNFLQKLVCYTTSNMKQFSLMDKQGARLHYYHDGASDTVRTYSLSMKAAYSSHWFIKSGLKLFETANQAEVIKQLRRIKFVPLSAASIDNGPFMFLGLAQCQQSVDDDSQACKTDLEKGLTSRNSQLDNAKLFTAKSYEFPEIPSPFQGLGL